MILIDDYFNHIILFFLLIWHPGTSLTVQWLRLSTPNAGACIWSLLGEHALHDRKINLFIKKIKNKIGILSQEETYSW